MFEPLLRSRSTGLAAATGLLTLCAGAAEAQSWHTLSSSRQLQREEQVEVQLRYAVGRLEVAPARSGLLYHMEVRYDENHFTPIAEYDREEGVLRLGVRGRDRDGFRIDGASDEARAEVALATSVPLALQLEFAAGEADLDLGGLSLRELEVSTGASETRVRFDQPNRIPAERVLFQTGAGKLHVDNLGNARAERIELAGGVGEAVLDFGGEWTRNASVDLKMGIGALTLRIPRELGIRIVRNSLLTSFEAPGLVKRGGAHVSRNWETAPRRIDVELDAALGSIEIDWID